MTHDELFMQRALELAQWGAGYVSPNPMVGCVIVHNNVIVGEGWHQKFGGPHAEVIAIQSVKNSSLLPECVAYVNLEPCSHTGKTPPCADLLIKNRIKRVVIGTQDPNPLVSGKGIKKLTEAGIDVSIDVLKEKALTLNKRFFTFITKQRPYIILKWAQTSDGFVAKEDYDSKWISNEYSRKLVHKWRTEEDAVLVGARTTAMDNPRLSVRDWSGRNPVRIVIDDQLSLDGTLHVFDNSQTTFIYNQKLKEIKGSNHFIKLDKEGKLPRLIHDLFLRGIQSVIVEGGSKTLNEFIQENLWDEMRVFTASKTIGKGIVAPTPSGKLEATQGLAGDRLQVFVNQF